MSHCQNDFCALESTAVSVTGGVMQITVIPLQMYRDYQFYPLHLCLSLSEHTGTEPVSISDGVGVYPVVDTNGQPVVSGRLRGHHRYRIRYGAGGALSSGTMPAHFTVYDGLCCMEYSSNAALQAPASAKAKA